MVRMMPCSASVEAQCRAAYGGGRTPPARRADKGRPNIKYPAPFDEKAERLKGCVINGKFHRIKNAQKYDRAAMDRLAFADHSTHVREMLNILSICVGLIALVFGVVAFLPLLGWAYWAIIPVALVGLALGAMSDRTSGRNLNLVVIIIGVVRLMLGGGII